MGGILKKEAIPGDREAVVVMARMDEMVRKLSGDASTEEAKVEIGEPSAVDI